MPAPTTAQLEAALKESKSLTSLRDEVASLEEQLRSKRAELTEKESKINQLLGVGATPSAPAPSAGNGSSSGRRRRVTKDEVLQVIAASDGMTATDVANHFDITYITAKKRVGELLADKAITGRSSGVKKIFTATK